MKERKENESLLYRAGFPAGDGFLSGVIESGQKFLKSPDRRNDFAMPVRF